MTVRVPKASLKTSLLAAMVIVSLGTEAVDSLAAEAPRRLKPQCDREAAGLLGEKPVPVGGKLREPKRIRHVQPAYPTSPDGTVGSGIWIGEALIDASGKVRRVWTLAEPQFTPPFPAFSKAVRDAIRQWEYTPTLVDGRPVPVYDSHGQYPLEIGAVEQAHAGSDLARSS